MSQNGQTSKCLDLGPSSIAEALGNGKPPKNEQIEIGDPEKRRVREEAERKARENELHRKPVTEEAYRRLTENIPGTLRRINFMPLFRLAPFALALRRQITLEEIDFFVGLDGRINSVVCTQKRLWSIKKRKERISRLRERLEQELKEVDSRDPGFCSPEYKEELKKFKTDQVKAGIAELELRLDDTNSSWLFTPMFWVDPDINPLLIEDLGQNGGDVKKAFMAGDLEHEIIRSGCFYTLRGETFALSGSPWFFCNETKQTNLSSSPLGQMAIRHPEAGNGKEEIACFLSSDSAERHTLRPRWHWGISQREMARLTSLKNREAPASESVNEKSKEEDDIIGDIING